MEKNSEIGITDILMKLKTNEYTYNDCSYLPKAPPTSGKVNGKPLMGERRVCYLLSQFIQHLV